MPSGICFSTECRIVSYKEPKLAKVPHSVFLYSSYFLDPSFKSGVPISTVESFMIFFLNLLFWFYVTPTELIFHHESFYTFPSSTSLLTIKVLPQDEVCYVSISAGSLLTLSFTQSVYYIFNWVQNFRHNTISYQQFKVLFCV